jgi:putative PIN family toxin of toxin-antitoxin system
LTVLSVTADTNIYVSGYQFGGVPREFLDRAAEGEFRLDISEAILSEMLRVLRDKFHWNEAELRELEEDVRSYTHYVTPLQTVDVIKADPSDNRILECAITAQSDFIVSGDTRHVLPLGSYEGIPILKLSEFMERLSLA